MTDKGEPLYEGKAKKIFKVQDSDSLVWMEFKDSLTAFNAQKKGSFAGKGQLNRDMASIIFRYLKSQGVDSHWKEDIATTEMVCKSLEIIPIEVVVRNRWAGSTAKKFKLTIGERLEKPLVEFYYKDDALGDPFLSDDQALMLKTVKTQEELEELKVAARRINELLLTFFREVGIDLIDFKLEFGRDAEFNLILGDEITPDSCRLWDLKTGEKLDKDRFREDLGRVDESYKEVWQRIQNYWGGRV